MPSPFPGMDPWLEHRAVFPDIHESMIFLLRESVNEILPEPYLARSRTRVFVERPYPREPDVSIVGPRRKKSNGGVAIAERSRVKLSQMVPVLDPSEYGEYEQAYLDIFTNRDERIVTSIEILSPINKRAGSEGRRKYLKKQKKTLRAGVSLVEIDLLRSGQHTTAVPLEYLNATVPQYDYHVCVSGAVMNPQQYVAAVRLNERLPVIQIPLDPGVEPISIELQPLLDRSYDSGNYKRSNLYVKPAIPPLTAEQQAWAEIILKKVKRGKS